MRKKDSPKERINDCRKKKKNSNQEQTLFSTDKNRFLLNLTNKPYFKILKSDKNYLYE